MPITSATISKPPRPKRSFPRIHREHRSFLSTRTSTGKGIWSNAASTNLSTFAALPPATRRRRGTSSPSSPSQPSSCGSDDCQQNLDSLAGLAFGHSSKLLTIPAIKKPNVETLVLIAGALGYSVGFFEDEK